VPFLHASFRLKSFSISFINNLESNEGIEVFSKEFCIDFKKFEEHKKENVDKIRLVAQNENFGINAIRCIENQVYKTGIVYKDENSNSQVLLEKRYLS